MHISTKVIVSMESASFSQSRMIKGRNHEGLLIKNPKGPIQFSFSKHSQISYSVIFTS